MTSVVQDEDGCWRGSLELEEKEHSGVFIRRFFILNEKDKKFDYYLVNPEDTLDGAKINPVGSFNLQYISMVSDAAKSRPKIDHCFALTMGGRKIFLKAENYYVKTRWIEIMNNATMITVPESETRERMSQGSRKGSDNYDRASIIGSYNVEVAGGVIVKTPLEMSDGEESSGDESLGSLGSDQFPTSVNLGREVLKCGYCTKQGAVRKNWKKRFFVLDNNSLSYYKSHKHKDPLKSVSLQNVVDCRMSIGIHLNRPNLLEVVTKARVFYIQADSAAEMQSWITLLKRHKLGGHEEDSKQGVPVEVTQASHTVWM